MKLPFVSRKAFNARVADLYAALLVANGEKLKLESENAALKAELAHTVDCYEAMKVVERETRFQLLKERGLSAFKDDRIRGALGLLYRHENTPEKKRAG